MIAMILYLALLGCGESHLCMSELPEFISDNDTGPIQCVDGSNDQCFESWPKELFPVNAKKGDVVHSRFGPWIYDGEVWLPLNPPMDVPAIKRVSRIENDISCFSLTTGKPKPVDCRPKKITWTCADKSRVLLTAEDGTRHCIKF